MGKNEYSATGASQLLLQERTGAKSRNAMNSLEEKIDGKTYTRDEVLSATKDYFSGDEMAATNWMNKYAHKRLPLGEDPKAADIFYEKTPADMHRRMAREFARVEQAYRPVEGEARTQLSEYGQTREPLTEERIFELFDGFKAVVPQGSVMASLGIPGSLASLSNCVVLPEIYDSYGGIMETDQQLAQLYKRRCGVGTDLTTLRPANAEVHNAAKSTSGAVSFMHRFSDTTREVAQNGRRGALMLSLDVAHPDAEAFATIKNDRKSVTGANISLKLRDKFMRAVEAGTEYEHHWPVDSEDPEIRKKADARGLWDKIIDSAHAFAEPGLIFWDRQHWYSTSSVYPNHRNIGTNPCSEIAMGADSCRLIANNLYGFVKNPFTEKAEFDFERFREVTYESQRLMDDLVDLELEHVDRIRQKIRDDPEPEHIKAPEMRVWDTLYHSGKTARRTGLGFTGLGDTLAALGIKYDSDEALETVDRIMKAKCEAEFNSSIDMAIERGQFDDFDPEIEKTSHFVQMMEKEMPHIYERMMKHGRRNISISTVAPTGTLSTLTQTTSGIEPVFKREYKRRRKVNPEDENVKVVHVDEVGDSWEEFSVYHHGVNWWKEITGKTDPQESPYAGVEADEIDWIRRVKLQGIVQKYTTHSISSTINLPKDVSQEEVGNIYMAAWKEGLKGITVYRDGSRDGVLLGNEDLEKTVELVHREVEDHPILDIKPKAKKYKIRRPSNQDSLHVTLTSDLYVDDEDGKAYLLPEEIFQTRAPLGAPTSVSFGQSGIDRTEILRGPNPDYAEMITRLQSAASSEEEGLGPRRIKSVEHAVGVTLEHYLLEAGVVERSPETNRLTNNVRKADLRRVEDPEERKKILRQVNTSSGEVLQVSGQNGINNKDCPECGSPLVFEEGCVKCTACGGYNKCG